jgi:hypothetical protein
MAVYISSCFSRISEYYSSQRFLASVGSDSQIAFTTTSHQKRIAIVKRFDEEDDCTWKISAYFSNFLQKKVAELWMEITGSKRVYIDMVGSRVPSVGIATKLVQTAIEIGLENGCQGHLELESEIHAVEFWKKCGLIPSEGFQMDDSILPMFLPDDQIDLWKEKIHADPIFVSTPV